MALVAPRRCADQVYDVHVAVGVVVTDLADPEGDVGKLTQLILSLRPMVELKSSGLKDTSINKSIYLRTRSGVSVSIITIRVST